MSKSPLKLGFIGGAINSAVGATHKISAQMDNCWELTAGCFSTHEDLNHETGAEWGIDDDRVYSSYLELLESEKDQLDAVAILTPTPSHPEIVIKALELGYPVICEKSLATSSKEIADIQRAVEEHDGFLAVTYNYTGYPMIRELRDIIQNGTIGDIHQVNIEMPQEGYLRLDHNGCKPKPQDWRLRDYSIPTVSLDLGVHLHHMIRFLTGEQPQKLVAINGTHGFFEGIIDNIVCLANYTNNLNCKIWYGKSALGHSNGLKVNIYGETGSAEWYQMEPERITLHDNKGSKSILQRSSASLNIANDDRYNRFKAGHPDGFIEAFANLYCDLADAVEKYKSSESFSSPWISSIDVAYEGLVMLETISKSAQNNSWESVNT